MKQTIVLNREAYSRIAVLQSLYWLTDRAYVFVEKVTQSEYVVELTSKDPKVSVEELVGEFKNTLLDFELRAAINRETSSIRKIVAAKAFASGQSLDDAPPGSPNDPVLTGQAWSPLAG